jgi:hypothetical protein
VINILIKGYQHLGETCCLHLQHTALFCKTLVPIHWTTQHHIQQDCNFIYLQPLWISSTPMIKIIQLFVCNKFTSSCSILAFWLIFWTLLITLILQTTIFLKLIIFPSSAKWLKMGILFHYAPWYKKSRPLGFHRGGFFILYCVTCRRKQTHISMAVSVQSYDIMWPCRQSVPLSHWYLITGLHSDSIQKTGIKTTPVPETVWFKNLGL